MDAIAVVELNSSELKSKLEETGYSCIGCTTLEECQQAVGSDDCKLIVIDDALTHPQPSELCSELRNESDFQEVPIVLMGKEDNLEKRLQSFEAGFDDYLIKGMVSDSIVHRFQRLIFNKVANDQLKDQLQEARGMAFTAMSNTSDLGVNIQFMLDSHHCDNLDELGMLLFQTLQHYGVSGSLQMRSHYGMKNMEANGMAKHLESNLLWELRERGRYVDFGRRSIMNYGKVSLLVKNMPEDDPGRYGALKDNLFSLLQGVDARITAIDNVKSLKLEKELVKLMTSRIQQLMQDMDETYQDMMKEIATVVEDMSERIHEVIVVCALHEDQETALEKIIESAIVETNDVFHKFFLSDSQMKQSMRSIQSSFETQGDELTPRQMIQLIREFKGEGEDLSSAA